MKSTKKETSAEKVIKKFGSASKLAREIGASRACVSYWKQSSGCIPGRWHKKIMACSARKKLGVKPEDLLCV